MTAKSEPKNVERGQRMQAARERRGLTQQQVAQQLDVDKSTIHRWESGANAPRFQLDKLAELYGADPAWLIFGKGDETGEPPYPAWREFTAWLENANERAFVEPWMLNSLRQLRVPSGKRPTVETYRRLLFAMLSIEGER